MDLSSRLQRYLCSTVRQRRRRPPVAANRLAWLKPQSGAEGRPSNLLYGAAWYWSYISIAVLCFLFFCFDTTALQRLDGSSPYLHRKTSLWCCSLMVVPPWKGISGKTKTSGITTVSRLPSHPCLVNFGLRAFELQGAHKLCILANGPQHFIESAISQKLQHVQNYTSLFADSWKYGFWQCNPFGDYCHRVLNLTIFLLFNY